jgi:hypothetical protein
LSHIPIGKFNPFEGRPSSDQALPVGLFPNSYRSDWTRPCNHYTFFVIPQICPLCCFLLFLSIALLFVKQLLRHRDFWKSPEIFVILF